MRAHQIMTRAVISVTPDTSIVEAANIMLKRHVSGLTVVDETGNLVGVVSEGDFIRRSEIGTGRKRGRWLRFILGPGKSASDFVQEHGRKVAEVMNQQIVMPKCANSILTDGRRKIAIGEPFTTKRRRNGEVPTVGPRGLAGRAALGPEVFTLR